MVVYLLISEKLYNLFVNQINHEQNNSLIYKNIATHLDILGFKNLTKYFEGQVLEEIGHRDMLISYLNDLNIKNDVGDIKKVEINMATLMDIILFGLEREILTKNMINEMVVVASEDEDMLSYEFLLSLLKLQRNEISEFQYLYDNIKDFDNNLALLRIFDQNLEM